MPLVVMRCYHFDPLVPFACEAFIIQVVSRGMDSCSTRTNNLPDSRCCTDSNQSSFHVINQIYHKYLLVGFGICYGRLLRWQLLGQSDAPRQTLQDGSTIKRLEEQARRQGQSVAVRHPP